MEKDKAIEALRELIRCEVESTKQANAGHGRITKKIEKEERKAVQVLFQGLVGRPVEPDELDEIVSY